MAILVLLVVSVGLISDSTDAGEDQEISIGYSDGVLAVYGYAPSGYCNEYVTLQLSNANDEPLYSGYSQINNNGFFCCVMDCDVLVDGKYILESNYNKVGSSEKTFTTQFKVTSGIDLNAFVSGDTVSIAGTLPSALYGQTMDVEILDSGHHLLATGYKMNVGAELALDIDIGGVASDPSIVVASFVEPMDCPVVTSFLVQEQSIQDTDGFDDYSLMIGDVVKEGNYWSVQIDPSNSGGASLPSYTLYLEAVNNTATVIGIVSENNDVVALIPNAVVLGGNNCTINKIGNGTDAVTSSDIRTIVLEKETTIETISNRSFFETSSLENVIFGEGLRNIQDFSFRNNGLKSIILPCSLESIGTAAFQNCAQLETIGVNEGNNYALTTVAYNAFVGCTSIREVTLPFGNDFIPSLDRSSCNLFEDSESLTTIRSANGTGKFIVDDSGTISGVRANWIYELLEDGSLKVLTATSVPDDYVMEQEITQVGPRAFIGAKNLRSVTLSDNLVHIYTSAFDGLGLESVIFGSSLETISGSAFANNNLTEIQLPSSVTSISSFAFGNNKGLTCVIFEGGDVKVDNAFTGCPISSIICLAENGNIHTDWGIFSNSRDVMELTISGPFTLSASSFSSNTGLKKVYLSGNIRDIDQEAFAGCSNIECFEFVGASNRYSSESGVLFDNGTIILVPQKATILNLTTPVTAISEKAFNGKSNLVQLSLSADSTVTTIPANSFVGCKSLVSISIPSSVTTIGNGAFNGCSNLSEIIFADDSKLSIIGDDAFRGTGVITITVPGTITSIGSRCFMDCMNLIEVTILGEGLETINSQMWSGSYIRSVTIPGSVVLIDSTAFEGCQNLSFVVFGDNSPFVFDGVAVYKGDKLIFLMPTLLSYTLPSFVTQIQDGVFDSAKDLQEIVVESNDHFNSYSGILYNKELTAIVYVPIGIRSVTIPSTLTSIGDDDVFYVSPFSKCESIQLFMWEGQSISLSRTLIRSEKVILTASSSIDLGLYPFSNVDMIAISAPVVKIRELSPYELDTVVLSTADLTLTTIRTANLCIVTDDQSVSDSITDKVSGMDVGNIYCSSDSLSITDSRYNGLFTYDVNSYTVELPKLYESGTSVFTQSFSDSVRIRELVIESEILSFSLIVDQGYYGDITVTVNGTEVLSDPSTGRFGYPVNANTGRLYIIVGPHVSETTHAVHFHLDGGMGLESAEVMDGGTVRSVYSSDPLKSGFSFAGWYVDSNYSELYDLSSKVRTDVDLYAKWTYNDGKYLVKILEHESNVILNYGTDSIASGELIQGGNNVWVLFKETSNWECLGWVVNGEITATTSLTLMLDKDYYLEPLVRYTSSSNDLTDITDIETPRYGEDVYLQYTLSFGGINSSMSIWSGFPSTPAIIDDAVYIRAGTILYKFDANTGEILATAESQMLVNYYLYLGVGGGKVFDYATGKVYDTDLTYLYDAPIKFSAVFYDSGYFYGQKGAKIYKMDASDGSLIDSDNWGDGISSEWFGMYGTTSTPLFINGHMYIIEARTSDGYRGLREINLDNGSSTVLALDSLNGRLLDDGWLTYTIYSDKVIIFLPTYSKGLFDVGDDYEPVTLTAVVVNSDGTLSDNCPVVNMANSDFNLASAFIVFQGRGYMNAGGHLYVVDVDKMSNMITQCGSGLTVIDAHTFESEYVIYTERSTGTHGSIVLSTGYYEKTGKVYVYLLPYNPPSSVYIFEDYDGKTEPTGYFKTSVIGTNYGSQAVRVTLKGNLIWYTDSGIVYCCGTMENNPYHFAIDSDSIKLESDGYGATALDALRDVLRRNGIESDVSVSGRIISLADQTGKWVVESYYDGKWNIVNSLSNSSNNVHHFYRITIESDTPLEQEITFAVSTDDITLMLDSDSESTTVTVTGDIPAGATFSWEPVNEGIVSITLTDGGSSVAITGLKEGATTVNIILNGDGIYGETQCIVTVIENPNPPERSYTFTLRMDYDSDKAVVGESNYSSSDLKSGITLTSTGHNAGEALKKALVDANIPCDFFSNETLLYWVNQIFQMEQVHYSNGDWKYWIQYQIVDEEQIYNDYTLGYYTKGGSFLLVYGITDESNQMIGPDNDQTILDELNGTDSQSSVITHHNEDGSITIIADSTSIIDGSQTSTTITTKENDDGSVISIGATIVTNIDGTSSSTETVSHVTEENGSTVTDTTSTTQYQDANGNVTGSTEVSSTTTETGNQTVSESTVTMKDAEGNVSSVSTVTEASTVTIAQDGTKTTESTVTETVKDSNGNTTKTVETSSTVTESTTADGSRQTVTETSSMVTDASGAAVSVSTTETSVKLADGSVMVVRKTETTENGTKTTDIAAGAISGDGSIHTTAESSAGASADVVTKVKTSADESSIDLSKNAIDTAIQQQTAVAGAMEGVEATKIIEVASGQRDVSVSVDKESFGDMAEANVDLRIASTQGSMTMDKDVLSNLSQKEDVTLSLAAADRSSMTPAQRETIESGSTTVSLKATAGGESIGDELGGKVTVIVKHAAVEGKKAVAYYVDEDGRMTKVADQTYDAEKGEITMVLDHFSIYTIVDEEPVEDKESSYPIFICLALIVVICLAIMMPQVMGRKQ